MPENGQLQLCTYLELEGDRLLLLLPLPFSYSYYSSINQQSSSLESINLAQPTNPYLPPLSQPSKMPTPQETWQDRRGMFQRGKEVHQPGRKLSNQFGDPLAARRTSTGSTGGGGLEKTNSVEEPGASSRRRVSLLLFPLRAALR